MRILAGQGAQVCFAHLSRASNDSLAKIFEETSRNNTLARASCHQIGVLDLMAQSSVSLEEVCLLDPKAEQELSPQDGDGRFSWFLFGVCVYFIIPSCRYYHAMVGTYQMLVFLSGNTRFAS